MSSRRVLRRHDGACALCGAAAFAQDTTITIATVNNGDMIRMQGYTDQFTERPASRSSG
jgi:sorbitol/mannitol transport system substrate-binding protein